MRFGKQLVVVGLGLVVAVARGDLVFGRSVAELKAGAEDRELTVSFPFANRGADPVVILSLGTSCGCVTASSSRPDFAPGASGEIVVRYHPRTASGVQVQTVAVATTASATSQVLTLRIVLPATAAPTVPVANVVTPAQLVWLRRPIAERSVSVDLAAARVERVTARATPEGAFDVRVETDPATTTRRVVHVAPRPGAMVRTGELTLELGAADGSVRVERVPLRLPAP